MKAQFLTVKLRLLDGDGRLRRSGLARCLGALTIAIRGWTFDPGAVEYRISAANRLQGRQFTAASASAARFIPEPRQRLPIGPAQHSPAVPPTSLG